MTFDKDNPHPLSGKSPISWPGKQPPGKCGIANPPEDPSIQQALEQNFCVSQISDTGYDVINKKGECIELAFSAPVEDWISAAKQLGSYEANEPIEMTDANEGTELHPATND